MTREESWQVEGVTLTILRQITSLGYTVSVFRIPSSLLGTQPGSVEMHALDLSVDPLTKHVARVVDGEDGDLDYRCACLLAEIVGIDLEDGQSLSELVGNSNGGITRRPKSKESSTRRCGRFTSAHLPRRNTPPQISFACWRTHPEDAHQQSASFDRFYQAVGARAGVCVACGFDFNDFYGPDPARDYNEVHHNKSITQIGDEETDLSPLCSNCHSMAHRVPGRCLDVVIL